MDLYLDRLLNLPNTTVESFTEEENKIVLKLRFLQDEIICPHCNTQSGKLKQKALLGLRGKLYICDTVFAGVARL